MNEWQFIKYRVKRSLKCYSRIWLDTMFLWKIYSTQMNKLFKGPYLFSAIYRVYKGAYFGQGFQLYGHVLEKEDNFQRLFDKFPWILRKLY